MEEDNFHQFCPLYPTSDARSEPLPPFTSTRQTRIVSLSLQPPSQPLWTAPSSPVKIKQGLWRDGEDFIHSSDWPPVQQYLAETSRRRRLAPAPTDIVFALAALEVLHQPHNPIHWLFWGTTCLSSTSRIVNKIALHRPRLIKTDVPWIGISEYKRVISAIQEKWEYVHVRKRWYPVDGQPETSTRRLLRSSGDRVDQTINSYFNLPEDGEPPLKRSRRAGRKAIETQDQWTAERAKRAKVESKPSPPSTSSTVSDVALGPPIHEDTPPVRVSSRTRLKTTPSARYSPSLPVPSSLPIPSSLPVPSSLPASPSAAELAILPATSSFLLSLTTPLPCLISSASSSHSRTRSTSQSSAETLVDSDEVQLRSASVTSTDTAVGNLLSKKRKMEVVEECLELTIDETAESNQREGMVTRGRASKIRLVDTKVEKSATNISRENTPVKEAKTLAAKPRPRAKKPRVKK